MYKKKKDCTYGCIYIYMRIWFSRSWQQDKRRGWVARQIARKITISREQRCYGLNFLTFVCIHPKDKRYSFPPKKTGYNVKLFFCCLRVSPFCVTAGFFIPRRALGVIVRFNVDPRHPNESGRQTRGPLLLSCDLT